MTETTSEPTAVPHRPGEDDPDVVRYKLYSPEFAQNPDPFYSEMRDRHGSLVPVELAPGVHATLVISYRTAIRILNDEDHFPHDPRRWQANIPAECPVRPMMEWYPAPRQSTGNEHARYRKASTAAIDGIDLYAMQHLIEPRAIPLINAFCETGRADFLAQYACPLVAEVINWMVGCPAEVGQRIMHGTAARFDTVKASEGMAILKQALTELIALKRRRPGEDVTSRLMSHGANLNDGEVMAQLMSFYGAGFELQVYLMVNTMLLIITDERFGGGVLGGNLSIQDAVDETAYANSPMQNFCATYPKQPIMIDGVWLPADQPVLISIAAANRDSGALGDGRGIVGNRAHLAFSTGPHACPARTPARVTVESALLHVLDALPEMQLAVPVHELDWRPSPFLRGVRTLPILFPPSPPMPAPTLATASTFPRHG